MTRSNSIIADEKNKKDNMKKKQRLLTKTVGQSNINKNTVTTYLIFDII